MDFNVEIRKKQIESIGHFVNKSRDQVYGIIKSLGWTPQKLVSVSFLSIPIRGLKSSHK